MAVTVGGYIKVSAFLTDDRTLVTGAASEVGRRTISADGAWLLAAGIAAGQGDRVWGDIVTAGSTATVAHDLATGGNLTDPFGAPVVFVKLRAIVMVASGLAGVANTTTLELRRPATAIGVPFLTLVNAGIMPISAGGMIVISDPLAGVGVVAASADIIHVVNTAGANAGYQMIFVGTSA
jgi:hypothetical protein